MKTIYSKHAPAAIGPYSQAVKANGMIYTSGQIPAVPETGLIVAGGIVEQTHQICKNLKAILEEAGSSLDKVIKTTCYLVNMDDFALFNSIYMEYFSKKPPRACVAVKELPLNALAEIELVALCD